MFIFDDFLKSKSLFKDKQPTWQKLEAALSKRKWTLCEINLVRRWLFNLVE